jgi:hypothetical protein
VAQLGVACVQRLLACVIKLWLTLAPVCLAAYGTEEAAVQLVVPEEELLLEQLSW